MDSTATSLAQLASDYVKLAAFVFAIVEIFKDLKPDATPGLTRLCSYLAGAAIAALTVWKPGMSWREYLLLTLFNGMVIGSMAIGGHQTIQRVPKVGAGGSPDA
jgi:hypothetical protein